MKIFFLITVAILLVFTGCGGVQAPIANEDVSKRPSIMYQPDNTARMQMLYPLTVGVLKLQDKRTLPFYNKQNFFLEKDMDGLHQMTYLELKKSGLFKKVKIIPENLPERIDANFLNKMHQQYAVDMIMILDVTDFNLFRVKQGKALEYWSNSSRNDYAGGSFTMKVSASMIGQLIYYKGGHIVWSGAVKREDMIAVKDGGLTDGQLSHLTKQTLQPLYTELKSHIATTAKRMGRR